MAADFDSLGTYDRLTAASLKRSQRARAVERNVLIGQGGLEMPLPDISSSVLAASC
jgi:hypothetical protein